jgi:hypothetical protein
MPQPYSADLRERVLVAYEQGEGRQVAIARRFRVCPATVCNGSSLFGDGIINQTQLFLGNTGFA